MDAELLPWLRAAPWPLGSLSAAFHHAEHAPRVTSSLTAGSPTIRSLKNILSVDIGILATRVLRARKTRESGIGVHLTYGHASHVWTCISRMGVHLIGMHLTFRREPHGYVPHI